MEKLIDAKDIIENLNQIDPESYNEIKENTEAVKKNLGRQKKISRKKT